ncbi:hypothetical protein HOLleu_22144 [Holothuria leucospilota]|uniref:Uncharacterized protein n=1 Tax=Holothuria leucospilota TaxID=206669 RepID=A0A9Q1H7B2_HOLLE|nr:hypothetical protein HOLleu_22144 [Holothuria leucospilota]
MDTEELDYQDSEEVLPLLDLPKEKSRVPAPSREGTSTRNVEFTDMLAQMQAQIQLLTEKVCKPSLDEPTSKPAASNQDALGDNVFPGNLESDSQLDFDQEIQNLLGASDEEPETNTISKITLGEQSSDEHVFDELVSDLTAASKTGPKVQEKVASLITSVCSTKLPPSKLKEKSEKYQIPENIELMQTTQVNKLIWDHLQLGTRTRDIKLQKIQMLNMKAMTALTSLLNDTLVSKAKLDKQSLLLKVTDALALMGSANVDLNQLRRDLIKPELKPEYKGLFDKSTPPSKLLFGDDIPQKLRDISDANKLTKRCMSPLRGRGQSYGRMKFRGRAHAGQRYQPFLGNRHAHWRRPYNRMPPKSQNKSQAN